MKSNFELIQYNDNLPARIELKQGAIAVKPHWHKEIELIYVPEGTLTVTDSQSRTLRADSVCLINSSENHSLYAENAKCLILDISYEFAQQFCSSMKNTSFEIQSGSGAEEEIHNLLWQLSRTVSEKELPALRQQSLITEILYVLLVQCRLEIPETPADNTQSDSRHIRLAKEYIEKHYAENFEETDVADALGIHPLYLSTLFRKTTGMLFKDYVVKVRLEHAMDALLNQHMTIDEAAKAGGFPSKRTFVAKCKRAYNVTPFQLIKQNRTQTGGEKNDNASDNRI